MQFRIRRERVDRKKYSKEQDRVRKLTVQDRTEKSRIGMAGQDRTGKSRIGM